jgi:hypothetical protein
MSLVGIKHHRCRDPRPEQESVSSSVTVPILILPMSASGGAKGDEDFAASERMMRLSRQTGDRNVLVVVLNLVL